eukprot:jgi/Ulvmu1/10869/UM007_0043.1
MPCSGGKSGKSLLGDEDSAIWYEVSATITAPAQHGSAPSEDVIEVKTKVAERLLEAETTTFDRKLSRSNHADFQWLQTVRRSGTSRDKIAACALVVEQNALANLHALDELIGLASKRGGAQGAAGHAADALKELFISVLLPDRRLVAFEARPLHTIKPSKTGDRLLLLWWVEDCIKRRYAMFLKALEDMATGGLEWAKEKSLKASSDLLAAKPEAEARLLALVVNKLGDPSRRVASNAGYHISRLLTQHPMMGTVVVREVETFLFRPNQKARARYYAVVTLNQMVLSHHPQHGSPLAAKLIGIYFSLFQLVLDGKLGFAAERAGAADGNGDTETRADGPGRKDGSSDVKTDKRGDVKRRGGKGAGGKHGHGKRRGPTAEEVDARLLGALLTGVRRAHPYAEAGVLDDVFKAHADQVFRTVHAAPLTVSVQALMLLFQVMNSQAASSDRFYATLYAVLLRPGLERSSALSMIFGLLFQAMKADTSGKRVAAFVKRVLQVAIGAPSNVACAALFIVSEVLKAKASLWAAVTQPEDHGEEYLQDASDTDAAPPTPSAVPGSSVAPAVGAAAEQAREAGVPPGPPGGGDKQAWPVEGYYSMKKRAPQFAGAERACWWELCVLRRHVHPSVSTMAATLLAGTSILYTGDPLADLTVLAFLEKFVKRNPKKVAKGSSVMQPLAGLNLPEHLAAPDAAGEAARPQAPGSQAFAALAEANVAAEDVFFHRYFTMERVKERRAAAARTRALKRKAKKRDEGSDEELDDEGSGAEEDGSAAEDDFLDDLEEMPDDMLGDPDAGIGLEVALAGAADSDEGPSSEEPLDEGGDSDEQGPQVAGSDDIELVVDSELDGVDVFSLPPPSDADTGSDGSASVDLKDDGMAATAASGDSMQNEQAGIDTDDASSIDEEAFAKAMFGGSSGDEDNGLPRVEMLDAPNVQREPVAEKGQTKKRKKKKSVDVFADYEQYADVLEKLDAGSKPPVVPSHKKVKRR